MHESISKHEKQSCIHHREVDVLTFSGFLSYVESGCHRLASGVGCDLIAYQVSHQFGTLFTLSLDCRESRLCLDDRVISGSIFLRPFSSESCDRRVD